VNFWCARSSARRPNPFTRESRGDAVTISEPRQGSGLSGRREIAPSRSRRSWSRGEAFLTCRLEWGVLCDGCGRRADLSPDRPRGVAGSWRPASAGQCGVGLQTGCRGPGSARGWWVGRHDVGQRGAASPMSVTLEDWFRACPSLDLGLWVSCVPHSEDWPQPAPSGKIPVAKSSAGLCPFRVLPDSFFAVRL